MKIQLDHNSQTYSLELARHDKRVILTLDGQTCTVEILRAGDGWLDLRFSASPSVPAFVFTAHVSSDGPKRWVTVNGQTFVLTQATGAAKRGGHAHHAAGELTAPMPGQIRAVQVTEGETVSKGQTLVVVEAMKMEIKVAAPFEGVVKTVKVQPGQTVEKDELLVEMESKISEDERK
jgi:biotin carboxyl carrier protein